MRRIPPVLIAALCICFATFMGAGAAQAKAKGHNCPNPAGHYPPGQCKFVTSSSQGPAGSHLGVAGTGYSSNASVTVTFHSSQGVRLGTFYTNSKGSWGGRVTIPTNAKQGQHFLVATDNKTGFAQGQGFKVTKSKNNFAALPHTTGPFANLPHTGAVVIPVGAAGAAMVAGGAALIIAGRRRRPGMTSGSLTR